MPVQTSEAFVPGVSSLQSEANVGLSSFMVLQDDLPSFVAVSKHFLLEF